MNDSFFEDGCLLGYNAAQSCRSLSTFQRSSFASIITMMMEGRMTSETFISYQTAWNYNPEGSHVCTHTSEDLKL
jgi:hypothetical protein